MMSIASLMMPVVGVLVDRFTTRKLAPISFVAYGLVCFALAAIPPVLPVYYGLLIVLAIPWAGSTPNVFAALIAATFEHRRGTALGIMMSGTALTMIPLAPILQQVIGGWGWRAGYALLGGMALFIGAPCAVLAHRRARAPAKAGAVNVTGLSLAQAVRTGNYWKLLFAATLATIAIGGFLTQLPALVSDKGLGGVQVGLIGSVFVTSVILGRIGVGYLVDMLRPSIVSFAALLAAAAGSLIFLYPEPSFLLCALATCLIGFAFGAEGDLQAFFIARFFGLRALAGIFGTLGTVCVIALGGGSLIFGRIYDITGSYDMAVILGACLFLPSGILFASLSEPQVRAAPAALDPAL
jgi:MFS family permease